MNSPLPTVLLILAAMLIGLTATFGQKTARPKVSQRLDQVLRWLPTDCETLVVLKAPLQIPRKERKARPKLGLAPTVFLGLLTPLPLGLLPVLKRRLKIPPKTPKSGGFLATAQASFLSLVTPIPLSLLHMQPHGLKVVMAVEASRRFTAPKGFGVMGCEGCQVLILDTSAHDADEAALETYLEKSPETIQIGDTKVAVFTEKGQNDERPLLLARPRRGVLVCANNRNFLEEVLARMKRKNPDRAFPDSLPEWRHIDMEAPMWGMRHYAKDFAESDPSSPLGPQATANVPDPKAVGLVFSFDAKSEIAKVRYLSGARDALRLLRRVWNNPGEQLTPTFNDVKPGVIEITTPTQGRQGTMFLFVLLGYLGHGIYL